MKMIWTAPLFVALLFPFFAGAQAPREEDPVILQFNIQPQSVPQGGLIQVIVDLTVAPGYHVYNDSIKLKVENQEGLYFDNIKSQPLTLFDDPFTHKKRETLEGQGSVSAWLHFPETVSIGERKIDLAFTYQVCSNKVCHFPKTIKYSAPIKITDSLGNHKSQSPSLNQDFTEALTRGTFWAFLFVFIGGFLTSFTPCIFPMIPITMSIIGARSVGNKKSKSFLLSLTYVLGIATTYSSLGVLAATSGAVFGGLLGNIYVAGGISLIFAIMGLSMLGLFQIQAPAFIRKRFGTKHTGSGFSGAFLAGLLSGLVASPCIGPVLIGILTYVAQTAKVTFGFALLFTFAMGMGLIFIVLGTFSGLLSQLPKAGSWMNFTKIIFGVALLAMSFYYIKPFIPQPKTPSAWTEYSEKAVEDAKNHGKPVIIDFWAEWCVACHELDEKTYKDKTVMELFPNFVLLKVDATHMTKEVDDLRQKYSVMGLPTVIFINKSGEVQKNLTVTGFIEASEFLEKMKKVL